MPPATGSGPAITVCERVVEIRATVAHARRHGARIGFVPTMGALHAGHQRLMEIARQETDFVVASIFVNPTQFAPHEDFGKYPRPFEADLKRCDAAGVAAVFHPTAEIMYPPGASTFVEVEGLSRILEGEFRPTHFRGVATVVMQLFQIVQPDIAFFGQKDFQQQRLIRKMCHDLHVPVTVRVCDTVREADGLAMSSRNVYLSPDERQVALSLSQSLALAEQALQQGETNLKNVRQAMFENLTRSPLVKVDYATIADVDTLAELKTPQAEMVALIAARVGQTRLIDNRIIRLPVATDAR